LTRQTRASQVGLGQSCDSLGCHGSGEPLEPSVCGAARRERYLLLEDDLDERLEPRSAIPERRRAVACDDRSEVRIAPRELGDALGQSLGGQLKRHVHLTHHATEL